MDEKHILFPGKSGSKSSTCQEKVLMQKKSWSWNKAVLFANKQFPYHQLYSQQMPSLLDCDKKLSVLGNSMHVINLTLERYPYRFQEAHIVS